MGGKKSQTASDDDIERCADIELVIKGIAALEINGLHLAYPAFYCDGLAAAECPRWRGQLKD